MFCSCVLIGLQLFRVYLRRNPPQNLTAGLAGLERDDMQWDVPCGERTSPFVKGCSPSACARYGSVASPSLVPLKANHAWLHHLTIDIVFLSCGLLLHSAEGLQ